MAEQLPAQRERQFPCGDDVCVPIADAHALAQALEDALEFAVEGWAYADDYFQKKWKADEEHNALEAKLEAFRARYPKPKET